MKLNLLRPSEGCADAEEVEVVAEGSFRAARGALVEWESHLPMEFIFAKRLIDTPNFLNLITYFYIATTTILIGYYLMMIVGNFSDGIPRAEILHYTIDRFQDIVYGFMPFITYYYLKDFFTSVDTPILITGAVASDKNLPRMYCVVCHVNFIFVTLSLVTFTAFSDRHTAYKVISAFYSVFYLYPFCLAYSLSVCIMLAHRAQAAALCAHIRGSRQTLDMMIDTTPSNQMHNGVVAFPARQSNDTDFDDVYDIYRRYRVMHAMCLKTSQSRGMYLLLMIVFAVTFSVTTVWSIYLDRELLASSLGYFGITVFIVVQIGWSVAMCNEMGHLACRELCTYLMFREELFRPNDCSTRDNSHAATLLLGCISYAKLEVLFFGNFALRSRHLAAFLGALVGSVIPAIVLGSY